MSLGEKVKLPEWMHSKKYCWTTTTLQSNDKLHHQQVISVFFLLLLRNVVFMWATTTKQKNYPQKIYILFPYLRRASFPGLCFMLYLPWSCIISVIMSVYDTYLHERSLPLPVFAYMQPGWLALSKDWSLKKARAKLSTRVIFNKDRGRGKMILYTLNWQTKSTLATELCNKQLLWYSFRLERHFYQKQNRFSFCLGSIMTCWLFFLPSCE